MSQIVPNFSCQPLDKMLENGDEWNVFIYSLWAQKAVYVMKKQ